MSDDSRQLSSSPVIVNEPGMEVINSNDSLSQEMSTSENLGYTVMEFDPTSTMDNDSFGYTVVDSDEVECTSVDTDALGYTVIVDSDPEHDSTDIEMFAEECKIEPIMLSEEEKELNKLVTFLVENPNSESENEEILLDNIVNSPQNINITDSQSFQDTFSVENSDFVNYSVENEITVSDSEPEENDPVEMIDSEENVESMESDNYVLSPTNDITIIESVENDQMPISDLELLTSKKRKPRKRYRGRFISDKPDQTPSKKLKKRKQKRFLLSTKPRSANSSITNKNQNFIKFIARNTTPKEVKIDENVAYKCMFCIKYFPFKHLLYNHIKIEHNHDDIIPKDINSIDDLREIINKEMSCCPECNGTFFTKNSTKDHIKHVHPRVNNVETRFRIYETNQNIVKCKLCANLSVDKFLHTESQFETHLKKSHFIKFLPKTKVANMYSCPSCDSCFFTTSGFRSHIKSLYNDCSVEMKLENAKRKSREVTLCEYCLTYFTKNMIQNHVRKNHSSEQSNSSISKQFCLQFLKEPQKPASKSKLTVKPIPENSQNLSNVKSSVKNKVSNNSKLLKKHKILASNNLSENPIPEKVPKLSNVKSSVKNKVSNNTGSKLLKKLKMPSSNKLSVESISENSPNLSNIDSSVKDKGLNNSSPLNDHQTSTSTCNLSEDPIPEKSSKLTDIDSSVKDNGLNNSNPLNDHQASTSTCNLSEDPIPEKSSKLTDIDSSVKDNGLNNSNPLNKCQASTSTSNLSEDPIPEKVPKLSSVKSSARNKVSNNSKLLKKLNKILASNNFPVKSIPENSPNLSNIDSSVENKRLNNSSPLNDHQTSTSTCNLSEDPIPEKSSKLTDIDIDSSVKDNKLSNSNPSNNRQAFSRTCKLPVGSFSENKTKNKIRYRTPAKISHKKKIIKIRKRPIKRKIPCYKCDAFFYSDKSLKTHLFWDHTVKDVSISNKRKYVSKDLKYLCEVCSEMFHLKTTLESHMKKNHLQKNVANTTQNKPCEQIVNIIDTNLNSKENETCIIKPTTITFEHSYTKLVDDLQIENEIEKDPIKKSTSKKSNDTHPFTCIYCNNKYKSKRIRNLHVNRIHLHTDIPLECIKKNEKGKQIYECLKCNISFSNKKLYRKHDQIHLKKKVRELKYHCTLCDLKFSSISVFDKHKTSVHDAFQCPTCLLMLPYKEQSTHFRYHIVEEENKIRDTNYCKYFLNRHVEIINKNDMNYNVTYEKSKSSSLFYTCNICNEEFATLNDFKIHNDNKHKINYIKVLSKSFKTTEENENYYKCKKCNYICDDPRLMYVHGFKTTHFDVYFNDCAICGVIFHSRSVLIQHCKEEHNDDKAFKCKICSSEFSEKGAFALHIKRKHDHKMIHCPHCRYDIDDQRFVNIHMPHYYQKRYHFEKQCPMCSVSISNVELMVEHVKNHLSKLCMPKYLCKFCLNHYYTKHNLDLHVKNEHESSVLKCDFCLLEMKFKSSLEKHIIRCHIQEEKYQQQRRRCPICNENRFFLKYHVLKAHADLFDKNFLY